MVFRRKYFYHATLLLIIELLIAVFMENSFVRAYVGNYLVAILIYCFLRAFFKVPVYITAISVLVFLYFLELLQYMNLVAALGLKNSKATNTIIGYTFEWTDIFAYTLGILTVVIIEYKREARGKKV